MNIQGNMTNSPVTSVNSKTGAVNLNASDVGAAESGHTHDDRYYTETETNNLLAGKAAANHSHAGQSIDPQSIELSPTVTNAGFGGYIDFHYNGSTADYTSRIIEGASGRLDITAQNGVTINNSTGSYSAIHSGNIGNYVPHFQVGTYTGNGDAVQTIDLPFTPIAVFVTTVDGIYFRESDPLVSINDRIQTWYGGFAIKNSPLQVSKSSSSSAVYTILNVRKNGFDVYYGFGEGNINGKTVTYDFRLNADGQVRKYIAWG